MAEKTIKVMYKILDSVTDPLQYKPLSCHFEPAHNLHFIVDVPVDYVVSKGFMEEMDGVDIYLDVVLSVKGMAYVYNEIAEAINSIYQERH